MSEINEKVEGHPKTNTNPTWRATIRRVVRQYRDFEPLGGGHYRLREVIVPDVEPDRFVGEPEVDHGAAQGMLTVVGNAYGYETFVSRRDQNTRTFQGNLLSEFITVFECPTVATGPNQRKIREIDVIWLGEDDEGLYPIYAFEVEMTTGVKDGLDRLLKIPERINTALFVIGPSKKERVLFDKFTNQLPFKRFKERFNFSLYSDLEDFYNSVLTHEEARRSFGPVNPR